MREKILKPLKIDRKLKSGGGRIEENK